MLSEHLIYAIAISILFYTIYRYKECFYIIIGSAFIPDIDLLIFLILKKLHLLSIIPIYHGDFHNILIMLIYALFISLLFTTISMNDAFILAIIGFGAHLLEDIIVYTKSYEYFFPLSHNLYGIGLIDYNRHRDFLGIANTEVLSIAIIMVFISILFYILSKSFYNIKNN